MAIEETGQSGIAEISVSLPAAQANPSVWTDIGEAEIRHTLFGKAGVRIHRRQDDARMAWIWAVSSILLVGATSWLVWVLARQALLPANFAPAVAREVSMQPVVVQTVRPDEAEETVTKPPVAPQPEPASEAAKPVVPAVRPRATLPAGDVNPPPVQKKAAPTPVIHSAPVVAQPPAMDSSPAVAPQPDQAVIRSAVSETPVLQEPLMPQPASQPLSTAPPSN